MAPKKKARAGSDGNVDAPIPALDGESHSAEDVDLPPPVHGVGEEAQAEVCFATAMERMKCSADAMAVLAKAMEQGLAVPAMHMHAIANASLPA